MCIYIYIYIYICILVILFLINMGNIKLAQFKATSAYLKKVVG